MRAILYGVVAVWLVGCGGGGGNTGAAQTRPLTVVVCLGDSLTYGLHLARADAYPQQLEALLQHEAPERDWQVVNAGISGNTTRDMLARFSTDVTAAAPQYVVILAGTNDLYYGYDLRTMDPSYSLDAPGGMKANVLAMLAEARAYGITPIVATVLPNGGIEDPTYDIERAAMVAWIAWERDALPAAGNVDVLDFYHAIESPTKTWYPVPAYTVDNLHPSAAGAGVMARIVADTILRAKAL
jgi:lysophospholipase L1-like esterase